MDPSEIKKRIHRFRILIIGRANAGKTTILKRVCNTRDNPEIFNSAGKKINVDVLKESRERGEHDIQNEMVFRTNPGFIFHDSRGFEAGGKSEYDKVNTFIAARSEERDIKDRIHTIWYCIPMDQASRAFTEAELKFFSRCDTGSIPVIVIFTKFDALYDVAFARLRKEGKSRIDAKELAPKRAEETFANWPQLNFLYHSKDIRRPPKCHVCLPDMDKDDADCGLLIERTAEALDSEALQQLFVSTQQTNLELCVRNAVERGLEKIVVSDEKISSEDAIARLGSWFPHIWVARSDATATFARTFTRNLGIFTRDILYSDQRVEMVSRLLSVASGSSPLETIVQLSSATLIILEHSFYIFDKRQYLQDQQQSVHCVLDALEQYMASPHAPAVREAVSAAVLTYEDTESTAILTYEEAKRTAFHAYEEAGSAAFHAYEEAEIAAVHAYEEAEIAAVHAYEEAVSTAVHQYQGNRSTWMAKLPLERFRRKERRAKESFEGSQAKMKQDFERSQEEAKQAFGLSRAKAKQAFECSQEELKQAFERSQEKLTQEFEQRSPEKVKRLAKWELLRRIVQIVLQYRLPRPQGNAT